ncbi:MAG: glycosyltransferase [Sulfurovum sp.]|nr:glycosyltransferase [Sulfurovum sp.]
MHTEHEYHMFLSQAVAKQVDQSSFPGNFTFYLIEKSPASLKTRKKIVAQLDSLEEQIQPDIVFSVFGPSYWKPKSKHLMGFADGWVYNPCSVAYDRLPFLKRLKMRLHGKYKSYYLQRDADYYVLETEDAKNKLAETVGLKRENIFVVGNTYSEIFNDENLISEDNVHYIKLPDKQNDEFRLVYIAHNHINKNLQVINKILPFLEGLNIKFVLTLDDESFHNLFPHPTEKIINLGGIPQKSCPSVYRQSDALFAPTLLETFSAAYPEAMKMEKPILTSNYSFATDVCQDTALYFDPLDPEDIAEKIKELVRNETLQDELVEKGRKRVKAFETARSRAEKYIALCEKLAKENKKGEK